MAHYKFEILGKSISLDYDHSRLMISAYDEDDNETDLTLQEYNFATAFAFCATGYELYGKDTPEYNEEILELTIELYTNFFENQKEKSKALTERASRVPFSDSLDDRCSEPFPEGWEEMDNEEFNAWMDYWLRGKDER